MNDQIIRNRIVGHGTERADQLLANPWNFRRHGDAQRAALAGSLEEIGWIKTVLVNRTTGHVIDGHARIEDALERGGDVPTTYVELTEEEERLALAVLDPISAMATQDDEALGRLAAGLEAKNVAMRDLLAGMLEAAAGRQDMKGDPDDAPEPPALDDVITEPGDTIVMGRHRLRCGDARDPVQLALLMNGVEAEVLWTDPPYGVSYVGKTAQKLTIQNDDAEGLEGLLGAAFQAADSVLAPNARIYVAAPAGPMGITFRLAFVKVGWRFHQALVWVKDVFVLGHSDYHYQHEDVLTGEKPGDEIAATSDEEEPKKKRARKQHEDILYGFKDGDGRPGRGAHAGSRWFGDHAQSTVLEVPRPKRSAEHPTMKPVELVTRCLRNSAPFRGPVLDIFGGSGTTLLAAEAIGRTAYLLEIEPRWCDVIVARWENATGLKAERHRVGT